MEPTSREDDPKPANASPETPETEVSETAATPPAASGPEPVPTSDSEPVPTSDSEPVPTGGDKEPVPTSEEQTSGAGTSSAVIAEAVSGGAKLKIALSVGGAVLLAIIGGALWMDRSGETNVAGAGDPSKAGFTIGDLSPAEAVATIQVTLKTGAAGGILTERVDLHLGTGFPFRLFPLGSDSLEPAFAAIPQSSSLEPGEREVSAGAEASFTFSADGEAGQDILATTPQLLQDLKVSDLRSIGFSSLGEGDWMLEGYRIEVNGKLFAAHDSVNLRPGAILGSVRRELDSLRPESEVLMSEISVLKSLIDSGLGSGKDDSDLAEKEARLKKISDPLNRLAGKGAGYLPWYVEKDPKFTKIAQGSAASPVGELGVRLIAGGGDQPGTRNPLYLKAGGKKFLLASELDPFANLETSQEFVISSSDLESNPLAREDLKDIGIGLIGSGERFGLVPDRAKLQRVVVTVDGEEIYDSETEIKDRRTLEALWLVPPVHFDAAGEEVRNEESSGEKYLWVSGMEIPAEPPLVILAEPLPPPFPESSGLGETGLPTGLPGLPDAIPGTPPALTGITGTGTGTTAAPPSLTGGPSLTGAGGLNPGRFPGPPPALTPSTGGGGIGVGGVPNPGTTTTISGLIPGSFVPGGQVDPLTGLVPGNFQRINAPGFTPIRSGGTLGGLNPTVFNQPIVPGNNPFGITAVDLAKIGTAILNIIKGTPATPNPGNPVVPPSLGKVAFPASVNRIQAGRNVVVEWSLLGGAGASNGISNFRVDLMPVLPHLSPPVPAGSKPLATAVALGSAVSVVVPAFEIPGAGTFPGVSKEDLPLLFVQPRVTALDAAGNTVGTAMDGAILPMFPDPASYQSQNVRFSLIRGISAKPSDDPLSEVGGSFQIMRNGGTFDSWKRLGLLKPGIGETNTASLLGILEESTLAGIQFAPTETGSSPLAYNTAVRTGGGNTAVLIFESGLTYPQSGGKSLVAGSGGTIRGYRVVGHLGFLSGSKGAVGRADVQMRVELDTGRFAPHIVRRKNGDHELTPPNVDKTAFFRLETSAPIQVTNVPGGAMTAFDIPISFVALDKGVGSRHPVARPAASFNPLPFGSNPADPAKHLTAAMTADAYSWFTLAKANNGGEFGLTVTLMIDTSKAGPEDTLGVFGLRVIPDIY